MEDSKPLELHELVSYMTKKGIIVEDYPHNFVKVDDNDIFTNLIKDINIKEALKMLDNNKELKFNRNLIDDCDGGNTCNGYFNSLIRNICCAGNQSYIDIIKIIQFLIPENINDEGCCELEHDYDDYCKFSIYSKKLNIARAIYIMFNVDAYALLGSFYPYDKLINLKDAYNIILETQDIIPVGRRNIPTLDIVGFVSNYVSFDIINWYYSINPEAYTKDKIAEVLRLVSIKASKQLPKFEKFFESIRNKN